MKVMIVDDEEMVLHNLTNKLRHIDCISDVAAFLSPLDALAHVCANKTDVAFLDIDMRQMHGLYLAEKVKEISPKTHIVFITCYAKYAIDAFKLKVDGYLVKPVSREDIEEELDFIRR